MFSRPLLQFKTYHFQDIVISKQQKCEERHGPFYLGKAYF